MADGSDVYAAVISVVIGLALAASCGFRVFVPLLVASIAAKTGVVSLADSFAWVGSWPAIVALSVATFAEVVAYYIPWFDNVLDTASVPTAAVAGTLASLALFGDLPPGLAWSLAAVGGGGSAGAISLGTAVVRGATSTVTVGTTNWLVSTGEWVTSTIASVLAIVVPVVAALFLMVVLGLLGWLVLRRRKRGRHRAAART